MLEFSVLFLKYLLFFMLFVSDILFLNSLFRYSLCASDPKYYEQAKIQLIASFYLNIFSTVSILLLNVFSGFHISEDSLLQKIFLIAFLFSFGVSFLSWAVYRILSSIAEDIVFFTGFFSVLFGILFLQIWLFLVSFP